MRILSLPIALSALTLTTALPSPSTSSSSKPLPLLIWHGLGDRYDAEGLHTVGDLAKKLHPGTHVHYIRLDDSGDSDRSATFFGNVTEQIAQVCEEVIGDEELRRHSLAATGKNDDMLVVDAIGFSQGGQFLRGLLQRCDGLAFRSLLTFGSQHNGIAQVKACGTWDFLCKSAIALMKSNAWTPYVQSHVVPAQYYRTLNESTGLASAEYLDSSNFLADVNNEREVKNRGYRERMVRGVLGRFVMWVFEGDTTVIPLESGWFGEVVVNKTGDGEEERIVIPLRERQMYKEDWIGLKKLDEEGKLVFKTHPGDHMQLDEGVLKEAFEEYLGPMDNTDSGEERVVFDCLRYNPSYLAGWWWEIKNAWNGGWARPGKSGLYKQGL